MLHLPPLYHMSFNGNLAGRWTPRLPDGDDGRDIYPTSPSETNGTWPYPEPSTPRISVSPHLVGCFRAIYPNVYRLFTERRYPYMDIHIYQPEITTSTKVVTHQDLVKDRLVWDAHLTKEHWILTDVQMKQVGKVRVKNTVRLGTMKTHAFGDPKERVGEVGPLVVQIETMSGNFPPRVTREGVTSL